MGSASMMVLMLILHVFRVYLTGGFKRPRELTWVTGVTMAVITVSFGVTGYSLPWDQVGYWAVKIVSGVPAAVPVVGDFMVELLRGGESVGQSTLTRFYSLHTFVLPWLLAVFMLAHFLMIRKQGISGLPDPACCAQQAAGYRPADHDSIGPDAGALHR